MRSGGKKRSRQRDDAAERETGDVAPMGCLLTDSLTRDASSSVEGSKELLPLPLPAAYSGSVIGVPGKKVMSDSVSAGGLPGCRARGSDLTA
jgi:hypothetical protein